MASVGEHLLSELASGDGDVTLILGPDQERLKYHSFVLRRSEYFKSGLAADFVEKQSKEFALLDVLPKHMKPLVHALYCDKLPEKELGNTHGAQDLWTMLILGRRFLFPTSVMTLVGSTFNKKLAAGKHIPIVELFEMTKSCAEMALPTNVSNALVKKIETALGSDKTLTDDVCLDLLSQSATNATPQRISNALLATFTGKLSWGKNVLVSMAKTIHKDVRTAQKACLDSVHPSLADMKKEFHALDAHKPKFDSETIDEVKLAMVEKMQSFVARKCSAALPRILQAEVGWPLSRNVAVVLHDDFKSYNVKVAEREELLMALIDVKVRTAQRTGESEPKRRRSQ